MGGTPRRDATRSERAKRAYYQLTNSVPVRRVVLLFVIPS